MRLVLAAALAISSSGCALYNGLFGTCAGETYTAQVNQSIPDNDDVGITSTISVPLAGLPDGIGVKLEYTHELDSDLIVRLAHNSIVIEIEPDDHGPFHEFDGTDVGGQWIINVADRFGADTGYWTSWEISICGE